MTEQRAMFNQASADLERDLRREVKRTRRRIVVLVLLFGWCVFMVAYNIIAPAQMDWMDPARFQTIAVVLNVGAAVYCFHVAFYLAKARDEWVKMIAELERMRR